MTAASTLIFSSFSQAAYKERSNPRNKTQVFIPYATSVHKMNVIEWNMDQRLLSSIWDGWEYNLGVPQFLTAEAGNTFYSFGIWKPEEEDDIRLSKNSSKNWIMEHGVNLSFGKEVPSQDVRYRLDMRWHEDFDTEFLFQMQFPFK